MRHVLSLLVVLAFITSCDTGGPNMEEDKAAVEEVVRAYHRSLLEAYQGGTTDLAAAFDAAFDPAGVTITYWGREEPVDSTRERALSGVGRVTEYNNRVENVEARVYGEGAVVTCIIRQEYMLMGHAIDEFLPTTYVLERKNGGWKVVFTHRSADFETIRQQMNMMEAARTDSH